MWAEHHRVETHKLFFYIYESQFTFSFNYSSSVGDKHQECQSSVLLYSNCFLHTYISFNISVFFLRWKTRTTPILISYVCFLSCSICFSLPLSQDLPLLTSAWGTIELDNVRMLTSSYVSYLGNDKVISLSSILLLSQITI